MCAPRHVLFVNATADEATIYGFWFGTQDYRVSTASNAEAAACIVENDPVDAIVLDVHLSSGESGLALARELTARPSHPRIVILSGYLFRAETIEGRCCDVCLMKPCLPNVLSAVVGRLLDETPARVAIATGLRQNPAGEVMN